MGMHTYYKAKDMLCEELENLVKQDDINPATLDMMDKLTHSIKSLSTIIAMEEYDDDYSGEQRGGMSYARRGNRRGGNSYDDMRMDGGMSYARRDRRGRYSRDDNKDAVMSRLEQMAMTTTDERMKATIHKCIDELEGD